VSAISLDRRRYLTEAGKLPSECLTPMGRFVRYVDFDGDCWVWTSTRNPHGYGTFTNSRVPPRRTFTAHRLFWTWLVGPVPEGLELDHQCRNPACVNPDHLEPVTHRENVLRGAAPAIRARRNGRCQRKGHPFPPGETSCRICSNAYMKEWHAKRRAALSAVAA
jgi:hypothetical protein